MVDMKSRILKFILKVIPALFVAAQIAGAEIRDPEEYFFNQTLGDFSEELEQAKASGKQGILIMFEQEDCPFCARMKATVLNQSSVQEFFQSHFLVFHVDIEGDVVIHDMTGKPIKEKDFAFKRNRVRATPVFIFYNLSGDAVTRFTGPTSGVDDFMLLGRYVLDEQYRSMSFTRYKQNNKSRN